MWIKKCKIFYRPYFWLIIVGVLLFFCIYYYSRHYLILGGESNYFFNVPEVDSFYKFSWIEINNGTGAFNPILNIPFIIFDYLKLLQKIDLKFANLVSIFGIYYLPFISMFFLLKNTLKVNLIFSVLLSVFYIINPFSAYYLQFLIFAQILFILPIFFILINRFFYKYRELFIFFGLASFVLSFGFANIPIFGIALISIFVFLIINSVIINNRLDYKRIFINFVLILTSFFLINFWWIQNFIFNFKSFIQISPKNFAIGMQEGYKYSNILYKVFSLSWIIPDSANYSFISNFFYSPLINPFLLIPFIYIILCSIRFYKNFRIILYSLLFILLAVFLTAGGSGPGPLRGIYLLMMKYIPFFFIFKSPAEKFGLLLIFIISITLGLLIKLESKQKRIIYIASFYLLICIIPFLTGNFIVEGKIGDNIYQSKKFILKEEYTETIDIINRDKNLYRVLSLPGSLNYQVALSIENNRYYTGMDPIMYALNKPFIAAYSNSKYDYLFSKISDKGWEKVLPFYNIKEIVLNKDTYPWFGFLGEIGINDLEKTLDSKFSNRKYGNITIYDVNNFLPKVYAADKFEILGDTTDNFFSFVSNHNFIGENSNQAIFLQNQLNSSQVDFLTEYKESEIFLRPDITFQKVNSTKYVIKVEKATTPFFLIFSESFSSDWKAYIEDKDFNFNKILFNYKSIGVKETEHEMNLKINDISYIFKKPIKENDHYFVNDYANAWYLNPDDIGSEDFTITLMYKPQFSTYFGILISIFVFLSYSGCAICFLIKRLILTKKAGRKQI